MACTRTQVKAIVLILLISGQDCARLHSSTLLARPKKSTLATPSSSLGAEEQLKEMNKQCSWKLIKGCAGPGCTFRPLLMDSSLSESCRLSDEYMLNNATHRDEFVRLAAEVLDKKSEKFKNECAKAKFWQFKKKTACYRRAGHMLQSTQLLMRAEQQSSQKEDATKQEEMDMIDRAIKNIASLFGDDGAYILELRLSMQTNIVGVAKDIEGSFKSMTGTLSKLLKGNEAEKEEARQEIRNMRKLNATAATQQDQIEVNQSVQRLMEKYAGDMSHVEDGFHQIDELAKNPASFEESEESDESDEFAESEDDLLEQSENEDDSDELDEESENLDENDGEDNSEDDAVEQSEIDHAEIEAASEDDASALVQMQRESSADRLSTGLIVAALVLLLLLFVAFLMPHFAMVFWGVLLPIFMVLIIGIIVFLIVRALLPLFRGRTSGDSRSSDRSGKNGRRDSAGGKPQGRTSTGARNGRNNNAVDTKNGRKGPTPDGRKGANNGRDGNKGATNGRRDSAGGRDGRKGAKDGRRDSAGARDGRKGARDNGKKRGAEKKPARNGRIMNAD